MEKLTAQEEEIMLIIWKQKGGCIKTFVEQLPVPQPPYTTVASIVKNLERKAYVKAERYGNTFYYTPAIDEDEYKRSFMSRMVRNYFANSYRDMVAFFVKEEHLSQEELDEIVQIIERGKPSK
jgi:predicted transcriptional regulator